MYTITQQSAGPPVRLMWKSDSSSSSEETQAAEALEFESNRSGVGQIVLAQCLVLVSDHTVQVLDTGMGAPKHPLFLMGRRFGNTEKQHSGAAGQFHAALSQPQQKNPRLQHAIMHAAMMVSHFWHVKVAHPCKTASQKVMNHRCSTAAVAQLGIQTASPDSATETMTSTTGCNSLDATADVNNHAARHGDKWEHEVVGPRADLETQHAADGALHNRQLQSMGTSTQQGQPQLAAVSNTTSPIHSPSAEHSAVDRDVEAQHAFMEDTSDAEPNQAQLADDVAAETARVEAVWGGSENLDSERVAHARPAILCRNLRKVALLLVRTKLLS